MNEVPSAETGTQFEISVQLGPYEVTAATRFGPRLVELSWEDSPNLLTRLDPHVSIDDPESGVYLLRGGHRLWAAPEVPSITYAPDDHGCRVSVSEGEMTIIGPEDAAGLIKELRVRHGGQGLEITHHIRRTGVGTLEVAPWAITQLPLGGVAIMPIKGLEDSPARQADRSVVLWPYSSLEDPRLTLSSEVALIEANPGPRLKLGTGPAPKRLGYLRRGYLFVKEFDTPGGNEYADLGAVGQVFVNEEFCELESLGPLTSLGSGCEISHREVWKVIRCDEVTCAMNHTSGVSR